MFLTAVDERIRASAVVNMVSAHFQGGDLCENAPALRLDTSNVEIAALAAPRPLLLVSSTQDWTQNTPSVEYPMILDIYDLYGAGDLLREMQFDFPHNYNRFSREAVYRFFARHLAGVESPDQIVEQAINGGTEEELKVFSAMHPRPEGVDGSALIEYLQTTARGHLDRLWPMNERTWERFEKQYRWAWNDMLAVSQPSAVETKVVGQTAGPDFAVTRLLIARREQGDWIPAVFYQPRRFTRRTVVAVHEAGKRAFAGDGAEVGPLIQRLLDQGQPVLAIDVFRIGEHDVGPSTEPRDESSSYFHTYNKTDVQERVQDIVTAVSFLDRGHEIRLLGIGEGGAWALLAASVLQRVHSVVADCAGIDSSNDPLMFAKLYVPGISRLGGLSTAMLFAAPASLTAFGCENTVDVEKVRATLSNLERGIVTFSRDLDDDAIAAALR
jgi:hypothetical protein